MKESQMSSMRIKPGVLDNTTDLYFMIFMIAAISQSWILSDWTYGLIYTFFGHHFLPQKLFLSLVLVMIPLLMSYILYLTHENSTIRREKLTLIKSNDEELSNHISELAFKMNVTEPYIYISDKIQCQNAKIFGVGKRKSLKIDLGLRIIKNRDLERFNAVILHELGHISNQDGFKGIFCNYLLKTTVLLTLPIMLLNCGVFLYNAWLLIPINLARDVQENLLYKYLNITFVDILGMMYALLPFIPLQIFMLATYASIMRSREHNADLTAAQYDAMGGLKKIFSNSIEPTRKRQPPYYFRNHPAYSQRLICLDNPSEYILKPSNLDIFLISFTGYTVTNLISEILYSLNISDNDFEIIRLLSGEQSAILYVATTIATLLIFTVYRGWNGLIYRFVVYEWVNNVTIYRTHMKIFALGIFICIGFICGEAFWPRNIADYYTSNMAEFILSLKSPILLALLVTISLYFSYIQLLYYLPRSEGTKTPRFIFFSIPLFGCMMLSTIIIIYYLAFERSGFTALDDFFIKTEITNSTSQILLILIYFGVYLSLSFIIIFLLSLSRKKLNNNSRHLSWLIDDVFPNKNKI